MARIQIRLTEDQAIRLRELADAANESMAAIIRRALDQYLSQQEPDPRMLYRQALTAVGKYRARVPDVSFEHDRYLEEEFRS